MLLTLFIISVVCLSIGIAAISAFVLILVKKFRIDEYYQIYREVIWKRLPAEFCFFCVGFWLSVAQASAFYFYISPNIFYIALPFMAAPLASLIYEKSRAR